MALRAVTRLVILHAVTRVVILREVAGSTLADDAAPGVDSATARGMTGLDCARNDVAGVSISRRREPPRELAMRVPKKKPPEGGLSAGLT